MLHRQGNKAKLAKQIIALFPEHDCYIEPFFGTGSIFFSKPQVRYNLLNDIDQDVFNLHQQLKLNPDLFKATLQNAIIHEKIIKSFRSDPPTDLMERAVLFLICANATFMSGGNTIKLRRHNVKATPLSKVDFTSLRLNNATFACKDWEHFIDSIESQILSIKTNFCYVDPPYLDTKVYRSNFTEQDVIRLLDKLEEKNLTFAYSEFDHPFILAEAERRGLNVHVLRERRNLRNCRTEILLTNYTLPQVSELESQLPTPLR